MKNLKWLLKTITNLNNSILKDRPSYPNEDVKRFVENNVDISNSTLYINGIREIENSYKKKKFGCIISFILINRIKEINKFFNKNNNSLKHNGYLIGCFKQNPNRKNFILRKYPPFINYFIYILDFFYHRVFSKLQISKRFYFFINKSRVISKAEVYGRLYMCGFIITAEKKINGINYFVFKKTQNSKINYEKNYGFIISLKRLGKNNRIFNAYKLRTMHPYSEYLQEYIYNKNKLVKGGKIKNDFRISPEGRFFRKYWLDELPMIINILKGDIKIVGVRPLSEHYFSLYREEIKIIRSKLKPGFIPPFYVDLPKSLNEIMKSEKNYMELYLKNPIKTDLSYLIKSLYNVFIKGVRSQ